MAQRWLVVSSPAAVARAATRLTNATPRDEETRPKARLHRHAPRVPTPEAAPEAVAAVAPRGPSHPVESAQLTAHPRAAGQGRPTPRTPRQASAGHIQAHLRRADALMQDRQPVQACCGLGTTISASEVSDPAAIAADNRQSRVEGGLRWRNDPRLFVASGCVNKPRRLAGLLMGMPLAWLVSSVTPRRRRQRFAAPHQTVPHPIHHPTTAPTVRWVFPLLDGLHRVRVTGHGPGHERIERLTHGQITMLRVLGHAVCHLYHISPV